jgi:hypothetical protein
VCVCDVTSAPCRYLRHGLSSSTAASCTPASCAPIAALVTVTDQLAMTTLPFNLTRPHLYYLELAIPVQSKGQYLVEISPSNTILDGFGMPLQVRSSVRVLLLRH